MPSRFIQGLTYVFDESHSNNTGHSLAIDSSLTGGTLPSVVKNGTPGYDGYTQITFTDPSQLVYFKSSKHQENMGSMLSTKIQNMTGSAGFQVVEDDDFDTIWKATLNVAPVEIGKLTYLLTLNRDINLNADAPEQQQIVNINRLEPSNFIIVQHQLVLQPFSVSDITHNSFTLSNLEEIINAFTSPTLELNSFDIRIDLVNESVSDNTQDRIILDETGYSKAQLKTPPFEIIESNLTEGSTCKLSITITDIYGNSDTISTFNIVGGASNVDSFTLSSFLCF